MVCNVNAHACRERSQGRRLVPLYVLCYPFFARGESGRANEMAGQTLCVLHGEGRGGRVTNGGILGYPPFIGEGERERE